MTSFSRGVRCGFGRSIVMLHNLALDALRVKAVFKTSKNAIETALTELSSSAILSSTRRCSTTQNLTEGPGTLSMRAFRVALLASGVSCDQATFYVAPTKPAAPVVFGRTAQAPAEIRWADPKVVWSDPTDTVLTEPMARRISIKRLTHLVPRAARSDLKKGPFSTEAGNPPKRRKLVERAKALLQAELAMDEPRAYEYLRQNRRRQRITIAKLAEKVLR